MQIWAKKGEPARLVGKRVRAVKKIHDSPRSTEPDVPRGTIGLIEDYLGSEDSFMVEFKVGRIYTVIECYWDEIALA